MDGLELGLGLGFVGVRGSIDPWIHRTSDPSNVGSIDPPLDQSNLGAIDMHPSWQWAKHEHLYSDLFKY